jgi:NADPH-dependent F420 reductase
MFVTIIGPGNMGRGITTRLLAGGHRVSLVGLEPGQAEQVAEEVRKHASGPGTVEAAELEAGVGPAEVVILALPYQASLELVREHAALLGGKVVVDISNPLNDSYTGLLTEGGPSAAETIRSALPDGARVVKAFNTTFARTLMAGSVSGQPLDVFIAGDDPSANERVVELARTGGMQPIVVGGLERARQLEALGVLAIAIHAPLGTGYMTGWKLVFPGTASPGAAGFPRNAVVGVLPDTSAVGQIVTELAAAGVEQSRVQMAMGAEGAAALRAAQRGAEGALAFLFGFENEHTQRHLREVGAGRVVIAVEVGDGRLGDRVGEILARHGATFVNYYSRWTTRSLVP